MRATRMLVVLAGVLAVLLSVLPAFAISADDIKYTFYPQRSWEFTDCRTIEAGGQISMITVNGNIVIADCSFNNLKDKRYVRELTTSGKLIRKWGDFVTPCGIVRDKAGNFYILDKSRVKIYKYSPQRKPIKSWGSKGSGAGQMKFPSGLAIDQNDCLYVCDKSNGSVIKFSSEGQVLDSFGDKTVFDLPLGIVVDRKGVIWLADKDKIRRFDSKGMPIDVITFNIPDLTVSLVSTIALAPDGIVYAGMLSSPLPVILGFSADGSMVSASMSAAPAPKKAPTSSKALYGAMPSGLCFIGDKMFAVDGMKYRIMVLQKRLLK